MYPRTGKARVREEEPQEEQKADRALSDRGKSYDFTLGSEEHERALLGSLRENFPFVANLDESQILFVDCKGDR